jgi:hypothetical protein
VRIVPGMLELDAQQDLGTTSAVLGGEVCVEVVAESGLDRAIDFCTHAAGVTPTAGARPAREHGPEPGGPPAVQAP